MKRVRLLLVLAAVALSIAALWRLSHKAAPGPEERALAGSWRGEAMLVTLRPDGTYWSAVTGTAGTLVPSECGRWHSTRGILQMRATWLATSTAGNPAFLSQPGIHLGTQKGEILELASALPGRGTARRPPDRLQRGSTPSAEAMQPDERHRLEAACGMHLPD